MHSPSPTNERTRPCLGYQANCKNQAVKGRLYCFTCAGRKSRNKKTVMLETAQRECGVLSTRLRDVQKELQIWQRAAISLRWAEAQAQEELQRIGAEHNIPIKVKPWKIQDAEVCVSALTEPATAMDVDMEDRGTSELDGIAKASE
ncbi:hypothetical protein HK104_008859 [Borealophlyctis nickersoniae]|nr:hypothetical protein HK104_008859 [Borealophlyctis nickersoniae]